MVIERIYTKPDGKTVRKRFEKPYMNQTLQAMIKFEMKHLDWKHATTAINGEKV